MARIFPKTQRTAFLRRGRLSILPSISELGVYGVFLGAGKGIDQGAGQGPPRSQPPLLNEYAGYLLRTKPYGVDEGGVASGFSVLNTPLLV